MIGDLTDKNLGNKNFVSNFTALITAKNYMVSAKDMTPQAKKNEDKAILNYYRAIKYSLETALKLLNPASAEGQNVVRILRDCTKNPMSAKPISEALNFIYSHHELLNHWDYLVVAQAHADLFNTKLYKTADKQNQIAEESLMIIKGLYNKDGRITSDNRLPFLQAIRSFIISAQASKNKKYTKTAQQLLDYIDKRTPSQTIPPLNPNSAESIVLNLTLSANRILLDRENLIQIGYDSADNFRRAIYGLY